MWLKQRPRNNVVVRVARILDKFFNVGETKVISQQASTFSAIAFAHENILVLSQTLEQSVKNLRT